MTAKVAREKSLVHAKLAEELLERTHRPAGEPVKESHPNSMILNSAANAHALLALFYQGVTDR